MKKRIFKIYLRINIVVLLISITLSIVIWTNNYEFKGNVPGTGFVYEEKPIAGSVYYDLDSKGKLYFSGDNVVTIYENGEYLYTLPVTGTAGGALSVLIGENDVIKVCASKGDSIYNYSQDGFLKDVYHDIDSNLTSDFFNTSSYSRVKSNGIVYKNDGGTIIKIENGMTTTIFKVPLIQKIHNLLFAVVLISIATLFGGCFGVYWKTKYNEAMREKKIQLNDG